MDDDTLGNPENRLESSKSAWMVLSESRISIEEETSKILNQAQHVQIITQRNINNKRPNIPANLYEKLAYFQIYTSSISKTQMACMGRGEFNKDLALYILNTICKSIPIAYVYMFLGCYSPEFHFFIPRMSPLFYGCNFLFVFTGIFELLQMAEYVGFCLDYICCGALFHVPWNRCDNKTIDLGYYGIFNCCHIYEFTQKFVNATVKKDNYAYISTTYESFNLVQFSYYYSRLQFYLTSNAGFLYFTLFLTTIWLFNAIQSNQIFKKYIWLALFKLQIAVNLMFLVTFIHLTVTYTTPTIKEIHISNEKTRQVILNSDINMLAESLTTPPVAHLISARSTVEIRPSFDSAVMILSNSAFYIIMRWSLTFLLRMHCESKLNAPLIFFDELKVDPVFNIWPIYFALMDNGDFYVILFYMLTFLSELFTLIITSQCFIEVIVREWSCLGPWSTAILTLFASILLKILVHPPLKSIIYIYLKALCTLLETIIIFWFYPLGRLVDDITFQSGNSPTKLKVWSFKIVSVYYFFKVYVMLSQLMVWERFKIQFTTNNILNVFIYVLLIISPFILGTLYICCYILIKRKSWLHLFKPLPEWGPKDRDARALRKQFDSREYIASQGPVKLTRYLMEKSESKMYKLDLLYYDRSNYGF